jgi:hypothetical protein
VLTSILFVFRHLLAVLAFVGAVFFAGLITGREQVQDKWDAAIRKQAVKVAAVKVQQAEATVQVVTKYIDRVQIVRQKGADIIKEVPVYVTKEADAGCVIPRGFARLHDAAAAGSLAGPAGGTDAAPAGIALSAVAAAVADNYERCHENSTTLTGLQEWVRAQQAAGQ